MADTTPDPRDMMRVPEKQLIPQPKSKARSEDPGLPIGERPPLPENPEIMAADVEDEEADPVVDTGPGIADGVLNRK